MPLYYVLRRCRSIAKPVHRTVAELYDCASSSHLRAEIHEWSLCAPNLQCPMESYIVSMVAAIPHARPTGAYSEHDALLHIHTLSAMGVSTLPVKPLDQHSALGSVASAVGAPISGRGAAAGGQRGPLARRHLI